MAHIPQSILTPPSFAMALLLHYILSFFTFFACPAPDVYLSPNRRLAGPPHPVLTVFVVSTVLLLCLFVFMLITLALDDSDVQAALSTRRWQELKETFADIRHERLRRFCAITLADSICARRVKDAEAAVLAADLRQAHILVARLERQNAIVESGFQDACLHIACVETGMSEWRTRANEKQHEVDFLRWCVQEGEEDLLRLKGRCVLAKDRSAMAENRIAELEDENTARDARSATLQAKLAELEKKNADADARFASLQRAHDNLTSHAVQLQENNSLLCGKDAGRQAAERAFHAQIAKLQRAGEVTSDDVARLETQYGRKIAELTAENDAAKVAALVANTEREAAFDMLAEKSFRLKQKRLHSKKTKVGLVTKNEELQSQVTRLETTTQDQEELVSVFAEKDLMLSMMAEDRLAHSQQAEIGLQHENTGLKALIEQLRATISTLTAQKSDLETESSDQETLLLELIEESNAQKEELQAKATEHEALLSVVVEDQLAHKSEIVEAAERTAAVLEENRRLEAAVKTATANEHSVVTKLAALQGQASDHKGQLDLQKSVLISLEKDKATSQRVHDEQVAALRERIEQLESAQEAEFWSSLSETVVGSKASDSAAVPAPGSTLPTPPTSPELDEDEEYTYPPGLPMMTSSFARVTDRQRPLLRAGVLVREALKFCHSPIPQVYVEELGARLPAPVDYRPYAMRDQWRVFHRPTKIPSPISKPWNPVVTPTEDDDSDEELDWSPTTPSKGKGPKSPVSPRLTSPSPSRVPLLSDVLSLSSTFPTISPPMHMLGLLVDTYTLRRLDASRIQRLRT